jgi:hypothetical protein
VAQGYDDRIRRAVVAMLYTLLVIVLVLIAASVIINFVRSGGRNV